MPIHERVQRLWRLVVDWWRPSSNEPHSGAAAATAPTASSAPVRSGSRSLARERPPATARDGEPLIAGAVTVRMWVVGGRLILATSVAEAERALLALLPELDAEGQGAARRLLEALGGDQAQAA